MEAQESTEMSLRVGWKHLSALRDQIFANANTLFFHLGAKFDVIIEHDSTNKKALKVRARLIEWRLADDARTLAVSERREWVEEAMVDLLEAMASEINDRQEAQTGPVTGIQNGVTSAKGVVFERSLLS